MELERAHLLAGTWKREIWFPRDSQSYHSLKAKKEFSLEPKKVIGMEILVMSAALTHWSACAPEYQILDNCYCFSTTLAIY